MDKLNTHSPYIASKIIENIDLILDIHPTEYASQAV